MKGKDTSIAARPVTVEAAEIKETDIVFDCPFCSKSLCIDYRGAGLYIICPDCTNRVQVPIPQGMEVTDFDTNSEEQALQIVRLRESLAAAQRRLKELETEVADLRNRRQQLEKFRTENLRNFEEMAHEVHAIEKTLAKISQTVKRSSDLVKQHL